MTPGFHGTKGETENIARSQISHRPGARPVAPGSPRMPSLACVHGRISVCHLATRSRFQSLYYPCPADKGYAKALGTRFSHNGSNRWSLGRDVLSCDGKNGKRSCPKGLRRYLDKILSSACCLMISKVARYVY